MTTDTHLDATIDEIRGYAQRASLDFFPTLFEVVDYCRMNEIASYGGFPNRYPHWRFGMEFERLRKSYAYGLHRVSEMVINNSPCYAYLLKCNNLVDQKLVIAHVYAHSDFFKNNLWFAHTNRRMIDEMANHASHIHRHAEKHGFEAVEAFLDIALSIDDLIDPHSPFIQRRRTKPRTDFGPDPDPVTPRKLACKPYMDRFINTPEFLAAQRRLLDQQHEREQHLPERPERDLLLFLTEHGRLERWQRDILSIIREESYYFAPQGQTKIMNEGWATYWHSRIMTGHVLTDTELVDYADHHAATLACRPGTINPYKLGVELFRDIEDRWNKGRFGPDYDRCDDLAQRNAWDTHLGQGLQKIFEVRRIYNDVSFIDAFLTRDFCERHRIFAYAHDDRSGRYVITDRDFENIKRKLLFALTNFGQPFIYVADGNHRNRGELLLAHRHDGIDLRWDYAKDVLANVQRIWDRPVTLQTVVEGHPRLLRFDGVDFRETDGTEADTTTEPEPAVAAATA
jgi:stage V sporulation protein R